MGRRCRHEDSRPSSRLDDWLFCPSCRTFVKRREVETFRFDAEKH